MRVSESECECECEKDEKADEKEQEEKDRARREQDAKRSGNKERRTPTMIERGGKKKSPNFTHTTEAASAMRKG